MSYSQGGRLGPIIYQIALFLIVFFIGCAHKAPVQETSKKPSVIDAAKLYKDEFQRFSAGLSAKIDEGFKKEFMEKGPGPVMLTFKATEWNSFYDRLSITLREKLGTSNIQFVKPDWEFSEDIFSELKCPEKLLLPEYKATVSVRHYENNREFLAIADARRLGSRLDIKGFPAASPIGGIYYSKALANWMEKQKRLDLVEGSPEKTFQSYKRAGTFLARLIECKMPLASDLWKKSSLSGSAVDFQYLRYRMLGLRPSQGVSNIRARKIAKAVYQELKGTGIKVVAEELDMETITAEIDKYDKFQEFFFKGKEAGILQIVPGEAFIVGDVSADETTQDRLEVSLRTILGARIVDGLPSQGIVIPALGGTCYVKGEPGGDLSLRVIPADAKVWMNNQMVKLDKGGTKIIEDLPFGRHTIMAKSGPEYNPVVKDFEFSRSGVRNWVLELPRINKNDHKNKKQPAAPMTPTQERSSEIPVVASVPNNSDYVFAKGISAPNQSKYNACTAARVIAQARLLEKLKGVEIVENTIVENGMTKSQRIMTRIDGILRGAESCGPKYPKYLDDGSCESCLRLRVRGKGSVVEVLRPLFEQEGVNRDKKN